MASKIKIKRSEVSGNPPVLAAGELAYSGLADNGSNGGDRLYIGMGTETNGNAANHVVIGGKYFTDKLDHNPGTLTASSALIVDADSKLDRLLVDNIEINGNAISTTNTNGDLTLSPNGTGKVSIKGVYTLPNSDGTFGQVLVTDGAGSVTFQTLTSSSSSFTITGNTGSDLITTGETVSITGSNSISTTVTNNSIDISAADATDTTKGVASFSGTTFSVTSGAVDIKAGGVSNTQLANSKVTLGTTDLNLGTTVTDVAGLTNFISGNIKISGNEITSTDTNGIISLKPTGTGHIAVNGFQLRNLADPTSPQDAVTKAYVDNVVNGLTWKASVDLNATSNIALSGSTGTLAIDGTTLGQTETGYRLLLTAQTNSAEDGIYVYTDNGTTYTLNRSADADVYQELIGASVLVTKGTQYGNTAWVQSKTDLTDFSGQTWVQFSGSSGSSYTAGDGLGQSGNVFFVNVATNGGIEISADYLQLKSTIAGNGLTYTNGVIDVVGTAGRINVGADSIDIDSSYVGQSSINTVGTLTSGSLGTGFTEVAVPQGGTGNTTLTARGILFGNGVNPIGVTGVSAADGSFLAEDLSGNPYWTNIIDGGTY